MGIVRNTILKKYLILCEGRDEENFLISYLNSDVLRDNPGFSEDIQIFNYGGNDELESYLAVIKGMEGFLYVNRIMIIRDAEGDAEQAVRMIQRALKKNGFLIPDHPCEWVEQENMVFVGFALFPACSSTLENGTLEDLCVEILDDSKSEEIGKCIDLFLDETEAGFGRKLNHRFKSKLHTYFSITEPYISMKVGEAAKSGAFDWRNNKLDILKEFIGSGLSVQ